MVINIEYLIAFASVLYSKSNFKVYISIGFRNGGFLHVLIYFIFIFLM